MFFKNPKSNRKNSFRNIYDNEEFKSILNHKDKLPKFPRLIDIELTNNCNLKCIFCGQNAMMRSKGYMEDEIYKRIIDECANYNTYIRFIRWGEPFLHPKIIEFFRYAKSKGLMIHVTNNGLVITEEQMREIVNLKVDSMIFSFQGTDKEHYEIMRNNHKYQKLKENIFKMIEIRGDNEKPFLHISTTVLDENEEEIQKFIDYWGNIVDSVGVGKTNLSQLSASQIQSFELIGKLDLLKKSETVEKYYRPCSEVYQKLSVDWDGKVTCCCNDYDNFLVVGDLKDSTLYDIWNKSEKLKIFRTMLDNYMHKSLTLCSNCYPAYDF